MVCCSYVLFTQKLLKLSESSFVLHVISCGVLEGGRNLCGMPKRLATFHEDTTECFTRDGQFKNVSLAKKLYI